MRISANKNQVTVDALSLNGQYILALLKNALKEKSTLSVERAEQCVFTFASSSFPQDEESKLKAASVFDVLRFFLANSVAKEANAIFVGGLFAYDLDLNPYLI